MTLNKLFQSVRATGGLGIIGVFTKDPKSRNEGACRPVRAQKPTQR